MNSVDQSSIVTYLKTFEESRQVIDISQMEITRADASSMTLGDFEVTEEGVRDFCKLFGISKAYFRGGVTASTLNMLFSELRIIKGIDKIQVLTTVGKDSIVRMAKESDPFIKLSEVAEAMSKVCFIDGDPGLDVGFRMFSSWGVTAESEEWLYGVDVWADFFGGKAEFGCSAVHKKHGLCIVDATKIGRDTVKTESTEVMAQSVATKFEWVPSYTDTSVSLLRELKGVVMSLDAPSAYIIQAVKDEVIGKALGRKVETDLKSFDGEPDDEFKEIGLHAIYTLYDLFMLFTLTCKTVEAKSRIKCERETAAMFVKLLEE